MIGTATRQEAHWQRSSGGFLRRLGEFYAEFADVLAPLELALYSVKHGLRLQVRRPQQQPLQHRQQQPPHHSTRPCFRLLWHRVQPSRRTMIHVVLPSPSPLTRR